MNPRPFSATVALVALLGMTLTACAASTLPAASTAPTSPKPLTPLKFNLSFSINSTVIPPVVALDKGYFAAEGLDVTIDTGTGSADAITKVASGLDQMGYADINVLMEFLAQYPDKDLQVVAIRDDLGTNAVVTLKNRRIQTPKDLEGKNIGMGPAESTTRLFPIFAEANGIDPSKITWTAMEFALRPQALIRGQVDAILGFDNSLYAALVTAKVSPDDIVLLRYNDYNTALYAGGVIVSQAWAEKNPEIVKALLRAHTHAMKDTMANPDEAVAIALKHNPLLNKEGEKQILQMLRNNWLTPDVKTRGYGNVRPERLSKEIDQVAAAYKLSTKPVLDKIFTDKYLPSLAERLPN